jgi:hypothetical protein
VKVTDKAAFSPRDTAEDLVYNGKMWISNAYYHGSKLTRDLWNSSNGKTWALVNDSTVYDGYSELAVYKGSLWGVAGNTWPVVNDLWKLTLPQPSASGDP